MLTKYPSSRHITSPNLKDVCVWTGKLQEFFFQIIKEKQQKRLTIWHYFHFLKI